MTLFTFLFILQGIVAAVLVTLVLMQRSEGGGLGIGGGGSPGGLMSARGAADFLSRATKWSAVLFVTLAIVLAAVAVDASGGGNYEDTLDRSTSSSDAGGDDLVPGDPGLDGQAPVDPIPEPDANDDPLADVAE